MVQNIVIGEPLIEPWHMFSNSEADFEKNDRQNTLFTEERFLPKLMVQAGIVKSINEVRRNRPELVKSLDTPDFLEIKWGKKRLFIQVGN